METTWSLNRRVTVRIEQIGAVRSVVADWRTALSTYGVGGVSAYVRPYIAPAIRLTHTSHTEDQHPSEQLVMWCPNSSYIAVPMHLVALGISESISSAWQ